MPTLTSEKPLHNTANSFLVAAMLSGRDEVFFHYIYRLEEICLGPVLLSWLKVFSSKFHQTRCSEVEIDEINKVSINAWLNMTRQQSYTH